MDDFQIRKDLIEAGVQVSKISIPHNAVTNQTINQGLIQVRVKHDDDLAKASQIINNHGLKTDHDKDIRYVTPLNHIPSRKSPARTPTSG